MNRPQPPPSPRRRARPPLPQNLITVIMPSHPPARPCAPRPSARSPARLPDRPSLPTRPPTRFPVRPLTHPLARPLARLPARLSARMPDRLPDRLPTRPPARPSAHSPIRPFRPPPAARPRARPLGCPPARPLASTPTHRYRLPAHPPRRRRHRRNNRGSGQGQRVRHLYYRHACSPCHDHRQHTGGSRAHPGSARHCPSRKAAAEAQAQRATSMRAVQRLGGRASSLATWQSQLASAPMKTEGNSVTAELFDGKRVLGQQRVLGQHTAEHSLKGKGCLANTLMKTDQTWSRNYLTD